MNEEIQNLKQQIEDLKFILQNHRHLQYDMTKPLTQYIIPMIDGAPTLSAKNGTMTYDKTNNKLYIYNDGWKSVNLT